MIVKGKYPELEDVVYIMRIGDVFVTEDKLMEIMRVLGGWIYIFKDSTPLRSTVSTQFIPIEK